ncbi:MAG: glutaredoxin domain-containing protein [Candidatus Buchananbacteria bacterium]
MNNKKITAIVIVIIIAIIVIALAFFWLKQSAVNKTYLYVSNECSHCKIVEEFIDSNGIKDKVQFEIKEVSANQANAQELISKAVKCGINQNEVGVPMLWADSKCIVGDQSIIDFFKIKAGIK